MTTEQIETLALNLEGIWSNSFYKKDHKSLMSAILVTMSDCDYRDVLEIIRDYSANYDNVPTVATLSKLAHKPKDKAKKQMQKTEYVCPKYLEDSDGYGYMLDEHRDYICIWKPTWLKKGITKMETLKKYGLIDY